MRIINTDEIRRDAYEYGYDRFEFGDPVPREEIDMSFFTDTAEYANTVLPRLRRLAGFGDSGFGTYTEVRDVIGVSQEAAAELAADAGWIDADVIDSWDLFDDLVDEFHDGASDGLVSGPNAQV